MSVEREEVSAVAPQDPIGTVLVRRGVITDEQLADALKEQRSSGEPLGAILVARGVAPPALVAQALATQHGSMLKTEYGFATGFGSGALAQAVAEPPLSVPQSRSSTVLAAVPALVDAGESDREAFRAELELASSESQRLAEANERLTALRAELEQRVSHETQRSASLERELAELRSAPVPVGEDLAAWQQSNAQLEAALGQWQAAYAELAERLAQSTEQAEQREAERAAAAEARNADAGSELQQARARAEAAEARAVTAEGACRVLQQKLDGIVPRTEALQAQVGAAEEIRATLAGSEQARAALDTRLQEALEGLREAAAVRSELEARLEAMAAQAATLEAAAVEAGRLQQSVAAATAEADELRVAAAAAEQQAAVLEQRLVDLHAELARRDAELSELHLAADPAPWAGAGSHLLFFQGSEGYELAQLEGPPPAEGTQVELPTLGMQTVTRVGRSPFRGDSLPCAYLVAT